MLPAPRLNDQAYCQYIYNDGQTIASTDCEEEDGQPADHPHRKAAYTHHFHRHFTTVSLDDLVNHIVQEPVTTTVEISEGRQSRIGSQPSVSSPIDAGVNVME